MLKNGNNTENISPDDNDNDVSPEKTPKAEHIIESRVTKTKKLNTIFDSSAFKNKRPNQITSLEKAKKNRMQLSNDEINQIVRDYNNQIDHGIPKLSKRAAGTWIYPSNYSYREYQYKIIQKALFSNLLVVLPTGLGKTFIAAVLLYNYSLWYPKSKLIFLAPTKPLIEQQLKACADIIGLNTNDAILLTGHINRLKRKKLWLDKKFF